MADEILRLKDTQDWLNPEATFSTFVVGSHNMFAHAAALEVSKAPGKVYNPLYLYSNSATQLTHLLHSIGNEMLRREPTHRVLYAIAEELPSHQALFHNAQMLQRLERLDLDSLFVVGVENLANDVRTMAYFRELFDRVYNAQKQIVLSSCYAPRFLPNMAEELVSRFEWGIIADIEPLDVETIAAILLTVAERRDFNLSYRVALFIAQKVVLTGAHRADSHEYLENILLMLQFEASSLHRKLDIRLARQLLQESRLKDILTATVGKTVQLVNATPQLLEELRKDYSRIHDLPPDKFELLICDRLSQMGHDVQQVGSTYERDGGVDIVAVPVKPTPFPYLLAVQVKHHRTASRKTGPTDVKNLQAVVASSSFNAGLLVTSTTFTPTAHWFAAHLGNLVRLRDMNDLKRWIWDDFADPAEWREIPSEIELSPGITVKIPRRYATKKKKN